MSTAALAICLSVSAGWRSGLPTPGRIVASVPDITGKITHHRGVGGAGVVDDR